MKKNVEQNEEERMALHDFFQARSTPLSKAETEQLTPILNLLKNPLTRYNEPSLIAEGGQKRVYRVFDQRLNRFVAMAQASDAKTALDQEQFLREGQLTANLTHPNIVPIYNMGINNDNVPFFSMELVPGDSLEDIINKLKESDPSYLKHYPQEILLNIFNKVCDAVAYAHSRKVLHLDIKPDNIRVGEFGEVFLCDWGLARVETKIDQGEAAPGQLDGDLLNDMTLTGIMKGTPGFIAPEQILGEKKTPQNDIYALGAILYMILTYQLPVKGKNSKEVLENTRNGNVINPRIRRPGHPAPTGLTAVAIKALAHSPKNRYATVKELQQDINRHQKGYPTQAEQAGIYTRMILLTQRHRKLSFWFMTFLSLLAIVMSINLSMIRHEKKIAEQNFALYKKEHDKSIQISEELATLSYRTQEVRSYISAKSMIVVMQKILSRQDIDDRTKQVTLREKARMHFMLQQFNAALEALEQAENLDEKYTALRELCREYASIKPRDSEHLSCQDLAHLLTNREAIRRDMSLFLFFHYTRRMPQVEPQEYVKVAAAMLFWLNEFIDDIPELKLSKRAEGYHLDLSHTPYSTYLVTIPLVYRQNVLQPLNLYSLDISHTPISLSRELKRLKAKELRMVGVHLKPVGNLAWILEGTKIERLILGKGDYSENIISKIRSKGIEVIEEEYEHPISKVE